MISITTVRNRTYSLNRFGFKKPNGRRYRQGRDLARKTLSPEPAKGAESLEGRRKPALVRVHAVLGAAKP